MIHLKRSQDRQWYFIVKAANGKTLAQSETYKRRRNALKGIAAIRKALRAKIIEHERD